MIGSQSPQPHLKDGSAYRQNRPTKLDKIKNFSDQVQTNSLTKPLSCAEGVGSP